MGFNSGFKGLISRTTCCPFILHPFSTSMDNKWNFLVATDPLLYTSPFSSIGLCNVLLSTSTTYLCTVNCTLHKWKCTVKFSQCQVIYHKLATCANLAILNGRRGGQHGQVLLYLHRPDQLLSKYFIQSRPTKHLSCKVPCPWVLFFK